MATAAREGRPLRGDRGDGQGVRQPAPPRAARPARPGAADASTSSRARAGSRRANASQHLQALHAAGHGHARRARAPASATRSPATRRCALWLALRDASVAQLGGGRARRARLPRRGRRGDRPRRADRAAAHAATSCSSTSAPREEFEAGHIEGARSIPLEELEQRLAELPADREIVAYCRGPFCAYAHEAVRQPARPGAARRASRTAGPNGGSPTTERQRWQRRKEKRHDHDRSQLDTSELEQRVKDMYEEVALEPSASSTSRPADRSPSGLAIRRPTSTGSRRRDRVVRRRRLLPRSRRDRAEARRCSTSAAAPAWTASSPRLRSARRDVSIGVDMTDAQLAKARSSPRSTDSRRSSSARATSSARRSRTRASTA